MKRFSTLLLDEPNIAYCTLLRCIDDFVLFGYKFQNVCNIILFSSGTASFIIYSNIVVFYTYYKT